MCQCLCYRKYWCIERALFCYVYLKDALCGWTCSCVFAYVMLKVSTKKIDEVQTETIPVTCIVCLLRQLLVHWTTSCFMCI